MKTYEVACEISGPTAMWTRPDTGDAPVSYPAPSFATMQDVKWMVQYPCSDLGETRTRGATK